jgi:hypothetical protein
MVRVRLGRDGIPDAFAVSGQWRDRLAAESFGAAVMEACQEAAARRGREWAQALQRTRWQDRLERLDAHGPATATPVPDAFLRPAPGRRPPPMDVLAEQVMRRLDDLARPRTGASPRPGRFAAPGRTLVITLSTGGQVTCQADPGWVASQTGAELTDALNAGLAAAAEDLAAAAATGAAARAAGPADDGHPRGV